ELWDGENVVPEIAEHLVRRSRDRMARDAAGRAEEEERALLLLAGERVAPTARELVDRGIRERQGELELGDGLPEHVERDRPTSPDLGKGLSEEPPVCGDGVQPPEHLRADRVVVAREVEARHLGALGGRDERLRGQQVRLVRERRALRERELKAGAVVEGVVGERREP